MRHAALLALAALPSLAAVACGGSPVNPLDPQAVDLSGSYVLTTGTVVQTPDTYPGPTPPNGITSPSSSKRFRLDLRRTSPGAYDAVITPEWGVSAPMTVTGSEGKLVLTGEANLSGGGNFGGVSDRWQTIVLDLDGNGLSGNVSLSGDEMVFQGDVGWNYKISASATSVRDKIAPELRFVGGGTANGKYLPWDKLRVQASEPVEASALKAGVTAGVGSTNAVFAADAPAEGTAWAGSVALTGGFDGFDVPGGMGTISLLPVPDRAGNIGPNVTDGKAQVFEVVELGAPQIAIDFDGKTNWAPATWGKAAVVQGADCESGAGCATFGLLQQSYCSGTADGLAARLTGPGAKKLAFRYRVHLEPKYGGGGTSMFTNATVMRVDLARAGAAASNTTVGMPPLTETGTPEKPTYDSGWVDGSLPLPAGGATLGFALRATELYSYGCGGGPAPAPVDVSVWVDSLRME